MHNVNGILVDINGELFPAVNVQVPVTYPGFVQDQNGTWWGLYFEVLFENGYNSTVYQEAFSGDTLCENPHEHFLVEICHRDDGYKEIIHAYHCESEEELIHILNQEKLLHEINDGFALEYSALADI